MMSRADKAKISRIRQIMRSSTDSSPDGSRSVVKLTLPVTLRVARGIHTRRPWYKGKLFIRRPLSDVPLGRNRRERRWVRQSTLERWNDIPNFAASQSRQGKWQVTGRGVPQDAAVGLSGRR